VNIGILEYNDLISQCCADSGAPGQNAMRTDPMKNLIPARLLASLLLLLLIWSPAAPASVMVLVHGYLGDGQSFHKAGVVDALTAAGWHYGGDWRYSQDGKVRLARAEKPGRTRFTR
jgi:hypothetical protein